MTQTSASLPVLPVRLPVPSDGIVFWQLPTDFYPWTELLADIERLQEQEMTAVLDIDQQGRWARFIWVRGQLRGGMGAGGSEVTLSAAMLGLPRAHLTLTRTPPVLAEVLWDCRAKSPQVLEMRWPEVRHQLERERFQGILLADQHFSFWEGGQVTTGALPLPGAACQIWASSSRESRDLIIRVWAEVIAATYRANPSFDEVWKAVAMQVSSRYPVMDPFGGEVMVRQGQLEIDDEVTLQELRPALIAAYRQCLQRLHMSLADLPVAGMRERGAWNEAGLGAL